MYGRILGLTTKSEANLKLRFRTYCETVPAYAKCVAKDTNLDEDFEWFISLIKARVPSEYYTYDTKTRTIEFKDGFKQQWFKQSYDRFLSIVDELDLDRYSIGAISIMELFEEAIGFREETYVEIEGGSEPLTMFFRNCETNKTYRLFDSITYNY